jgi:hypothetical protein
MAGDPMSARDWFHPDAGTWVAFRDEPKRRRDPESRGYVTVPGEVTRCYLYDARTGIGMVGSPEKCARFDTKAEALAAARARWPRRVQGCRIGAERVVT